jgi:hypothetical protein
MSGKKKSAMFLPDDRRDPDQVVPSLREGDPRGLKDVGVIEEAEHLGFPADAVLLAIDTKHRGHRGEEGAQEAAVEDLLQVHRHPVLAIRQGEGGRRQDIGGVTGGDSRLDHGGVIGERAKGTRGDGQTRVSVVEVVLDALPEGRVFGVPRPDVDVGLFT